MYGALIILDSSQSTSSFSDQLFIASDWWRESAETFEDTDDNPVISRDAVGQFLSDVHFHSFVINGRGVEDVSLLAGDKILSAGVSVFKVNGKKRAVKFRIINAGIIFGFRFQVAYHQIR